MKILNFKLLVLLIVIFQVTHVAQSLKSISPTETSAKLGDTFDNYIEAKNVTNLFGTSFNYHYNNKYLKINSAIAESFLGSDVVFMPNDDANNGILSIGISKKNGQTNANGTGNIIKVTFEIVNLPQQDSSINFTISDITASDSLGSSISLSSVESITLLKLSEADSNKIFPISPSVISGIIGTEFNTSIYVENVNNLFGVSFDFNYSNKLFEVLSVQQDTLLGNDVVFYPNIDNANGVAGIGISKKAGQTNVNGSGILLNIKTKLISLPLQDSSVTFSISNIVTSDKDGNSITLFDSTSISLIDISTNIDEAFEVIPNEYSLQQNYPNPFNPTTIISYSLPKQSLVDIKVYDVLGNLVDELVNKYQNVGNYTVKFNANDLSSGVYFYKIDADKFSSIKKMLLLR